MNAWLAAPSPSPSPSPSPGPTLADQMVTSPLFWATILVLIIVVAWVRFNSGPRGGGWGDW